MAIGDDEVFSFAGVAPKNLYWLKDGEQEKDLFLVLGINVHSDRQANLHLPSLRNLRPATACWAPLNVAKDNIPVPANPNRTH